MSAFSIEATELTNAEFRASVEATGYFTTAESALDPANHTGLLPDLSLPGAMVFEGQISGRTEELS